MKIRYYVIYTVAIFFLFCAFSYADEQAGATDNMSATDDGRSVKDIKDTVKKYIEKHTGLNGAFQVYDNTIKNYRRGKLIGIQNFVGKAGNSYYCRADFKDIDNDLNYDVDIYLRYMSGMPVITEMFIHMVKDKERYTYDQDGNRIPVSP